MLDSLPSLPPRPTLNLVGGLSLGFAFWAYTHVFKASLKFNDFFNTSILLESL